jgi:hypothetical protein
MYKRCERLLAEVRRVGGPGARDPQSVARVFGAFFTTERMRE